MAVNAVVGPRELLDRRRRETSLGPWADALDSAGGDADAQRKQEASRRTEWCMATSRFLTLSPSLSALPKSTCSAISAPRQLTRACLAGSRITLIHERVGPEEETALVMEPSEALQAPRRHQPNACVRLADPSPPTCPRAQILNGHTSPLCELSIQTPYSILRRAYRRLRSQLRCWVSPTDSALFSFAQQC